MRHDPDRARTPRAPGKGASLIEVLIGVLVFSLGAAVLLHGQRQTWMAIEAAQSRTELTLVAADDIESLRALPPGEGTPDAPRGDPWNALVTSGSGTLDLPGLGPARWRRDVRATDIPLLKTVEVSVSGVTRDGRETQTALHAWIASVDARLGAIATLARNTDPPAALPVHITGAPPLTLPPEALPLGGRLSLLRLRGDPRSPG